MEAMDCAKIDELLLDARSIEAIQHIKSMKEVRNHLPLLLAAGIFANIFVGNNTLKIAYNIKETDWELFAIAMRKFPSFAQARAYQCGR